MNNGAFGENFPYSNFHDLNMDWIIKIAKDFLDQYTHIQDVINAGLESLDGKTTEGLESLQDKYDTLNGLLQDWYTEHSADIANELADALADIADELATAIHTFNVSAEDKASEVIASIPSTYTELFDNLVEYKKYIDALNSALGLENLFTSIDIQSDLNVDTTRTPFNAKAGDHLVITLSGDALTTDNPTLYFRYAGSDTFTYINTITKDVPAYVILANDITGVACYASHHGTGALNINIEKYEGNNIDNIRNEAELVWKSNGLNPVSKTFKNYATSHGNAYLQMACNIPAFNRFQVLVTGTAFTTNTVALYFKYAGEDSLTYIGTLNVNNLETFTAGKAVTAIALYATSLTVNKEITITYCINNTQGGKDHTETPITKHYKNVIGDILRCGGYSPFLSPKINSGGNAYIPPFPVLPNTMYTLSTSEDATDSNSAYYIIEFDANYNQITASEGVNKNRLPFTVTTNANTAFIGIQTYSAQANGWANTIPSWIQLEKGAEATEYENPYSLDVYRIHDFNTRIENTYGVKSRNLVTTEWVCGQYTVANGYVIRNTGNNASIQPFPIKENTPYTISFPYDAVNSDSYYYYVFLDSAYNVLSVTGIYKYNLQQFQKITVISPANAVYMGIQTYTATGQNNWHNSIPSWIQCEEGEEATSYVEEYTIADKNNSDFPELPDYYNGYMARKAKRINDLATECATNSDVFIFITDQHWTLNRRNSVKLINYLNKHCFIPEVNNGGDTADLISVEYVRQLANNFNHNIRYVMGNHEWFANDRNKMYYMTHMTNNDQIGNNNQLYFYVDNPQTKMRHIYLNSYMNNGTGTEDIESGYTEAERTWLQNVALNIDNDWSIVVFTHAIDNGNTGASETKAILDTAKSNGKDIIAIFQGHAHFDSINATSGGIPIIITTCDKNQPWYNNGTNMEPWLDRDRITGTIYEQAFDVVVINRTTRTINAVRIGGLAMNNRNIWSASDPNFNDVGTLEERTITY